MLVSFYYVGGYAVKNTSLLNIPSVPDPEYFEVGWKKVTNALNRFASVTCVRPEGARIFVTVVRSAPYPSNRMQEGGRTREGGNRGIGTVHPAKRVLLCTCT